MHYDHHLSRAVPSDVPNVAARAETALKNRAENGAETAAVRHLPSPLEGDLRDYEPDAEILTCDVNVAPAAWLASRPAAAASSRPGSTRGI